MGILIGFIIFFHIVYIIVTEYVSAKKSKGEVLVFRRGNMPAVSRGKVDSKAASTDPITAVDKLNNYCVKLGTLIALRLKAEGVSTGSATHENDPGSYREFAAPFWEQLVAMFIGLIILNTPLPIQGLQNLIVFGQLIQQQMPHFVTQRPLYETAERGALIWLLFWQFLIFTCTFAHAYITITDTTEAGANLANIIFILCLFFCVSSILSTDLANTEVTYASNEYVIFDPPNGIIYGTFLQDYNAAASDYILNENATSQCNFYTIKDTNDYLDALSSKYENRWRDFGIGMVYIMVNIVGALALYWLVRMPKNKNEKK
ncbi:ATPase [Fusarium proliferatum]|nr:ATPase [Fusarium proliferatum]